MMNLKAMACAISSSTVGSTQFPHGIIDPISAIAALTWQCGSNIGVHVDSCLARPSWGDGWLRHRTFWFPCVPGVTISAPTSMPTRQGELSVLMYSNKKLCQNQYFVAPNWPGDIYLTYKIYWPISILGDRRHSSLPQYLYIIFNYSCGTFDSLRLL